MVVTTVVVVDDQPSFLEGLALIFNENHQYIHVVDTMCSIDATKLSSIVKNKTPDLVMIDLMMPPGNAGLDMIPLVPESKIVVLSGTTDSSLIFEAFRRGAKGFIPKSMPTDKYWRPLEMVKRGWTLNPTYLSDEMIPKLREQTIPYGMDSQKIRIWTLVAQGMSNEEIATDLNVNVRTATRWVKDMMESIGARNRYHAAALAGRSGLS